MGKQRRDGSILSTALTGGQHRNASELDLRTYRCMITKILYIDDQLNVTFDNKQVTYEAIILGGRKEGQQIVNIKAQGQGGGQYNFHERIYRATEFSFSGKGKKPLSEHNGDIVYIHYINGNTSLPIISGSGTSPLDKTATGATKADGHRFIDQYNGIQNLIDRDGKYTITRFGGKWQNDAGFFKPTEEAEIIVAFEENKMTTTLKNGMVMTLDSTSKKITINSGGSFIEIDSNSGKITISSDAVDIGVSVSDFAVLFTELASAFDEHTHPFIDITPGGPVPKVTDPPLAPLISTVGSQTIKIQS